MLDLWTSSFQGDASDLILLLEEDGEKKWGSTTSLGFWEDHSTAAPRCVLNRSLTLWQQFVKGAGRLGDGCFCLLPASSVLNPVEIGKASSVYLLRTAFFVCCSPVDS